MSKEVAGFIARSGKVGLFGYFDDGGIGDFFDEFEIGWR